MSEPKWKVFWMRTILIHLIGQNPDETWSSSIPLESDANSTNNRSSSALSGSERELLSTEEFSPKDGKMEEDNDGENDIFRNWGRTDSFSRCIINFSNGEKY